MTNPSKQGSSQHAHSESTSLSKSELMAMRLSLRKFFQNELKPRVEESENTGVFDHATLKKLGQMGYAAPIFPDPFGSDSLMAQTIVAEEMGYVCSGFGLSVLASVVLFGANVARQGSDEQKKKYLPGIASGEKVGCWALTEPGIGSDAVSIKTRCHRDGDHYIINGSKTFITNAPNADYFVVLTREFGPDQKPIEGFGGGTAFILERNTEGLKTGSPFKKLGHKSSPTGEVFLENVRVPMSQVLGKPGHAFLGMKVSLDVERAVFGGLGVGMMEFLLHSTVKYASTRKQFGVPILEHQMIQEKIAEISASLDITRTYLYNVVDKINCGESVTKEAAILKLHGARVAFDACREAIQVLGGYGYMQEYDVERCLRDAKLYEIGGGTNEVQKMIIAKQSVKELMDAFGQGSAKRG